MTDEYILSLWRTAREHLNKEIKDINQSIRESQRKIRHWNCLKNVKDAQLRFAIQRIDLLEGKSDDSDEQGSD